MKKIIFVLFLISILIISGCGNGTTEEKILEEPKITPEEWQEYSDAEEYCRALDYFDAREEGQTKCIKDQISWGLARKIEKYDAWLEEKNKLEYEEEKKREEEFKELKCVLAVNNDKIAGLQEDDEILEVNNQKIENPEDFVNLLGLIRDDPFKYIMNQEIPLSTAVTIKTQLSEIKTTRENLINLDIGGRYIKRDEQGNVIDSLPCEIPSYYILIHR